jgi:hypothetical protein
MEDLVPGILPVSGDGKKFPLTAAEGHVSNSSESTSASMDLPPAYGLGSPGEFRVQLYAEFQYLDDYELGSQKVSLSSFDTPMLVNGHKLHHSDSATAVDRTAGPSISFAGPYATPVLRNNAKSVYLQALEEIEVSRSVVRTNHALYRRWFGDEARANVDYVANVYEQLRVATNQDTLTLYFWGPKCERNWYAYTYRKTRVIYLCEELWMNISDTGLTHGLKSKVDTLVHELTHAIAGTDDIVYGVSNCLRLAATDRDNAVINADNYSHFSREAWT